MKKNLLKLLTLVLALVMVVTVFAGCKKADEETDAPTQGSEETPTETQEQPADEYKPSTAQLLNGKEWGKDFTELYDEIGDKVTIDDVQEDPTTGLAYVEYEGKTYELGMDFLSMAMVYKTAVPENSQYETEDDVYAAWWKYYMTRWNYLLPEIPLYSNEYYDVYNAQIKGVDEHPTNPYWGPAKALIDWTSEKTDKDIIIGNTTDLSGKFRYSNFGGSNPGASDLDVDNLINGMETVATTKEGGFEVNKTVVKQLDKVENEDGTLTYTITLNDGLLFSDGTPVTAKNYLYYTMVFSTLVASEAEGKDRQAGLTIVGFEEFNAYDGTNEGDGVSKTFTGLRLLADNQFSVTVKPEYANYYYAISYAGFSPFVKELWCGDFDIADDGEGCYFTDGFYNKTGDSFDMAAHLVASSNNTDTTYACSGPYAVESYDERIDPVGACVGMKGSRIYSIVKELRNENIDVVNYTANPTLMIQRSLNPAKVSSITIDEEKMTASVYLKPDQVSLAIGKGGLNIRLSKMLTGYDIDVYREVEEEDVALTEFADEIDGWVIDALKAAGCDTAKSVLELPVEEIAARADLELEQAQKVVEILKAEFE